MQQLVPDSDCVPAIFQGSTQECYPKWEDRIWVGQGVCTEQQHFCGVRRHISANQEDHRLIQSSENQREIKALLSSGLGSMIVNNGL